MSRVFQCHAPRQLSSCAQYRSLTSVRSIFGWNRKAEERDFIPEIVEDGKVDGEGDGNDAYHASVPGERWDVPAETPLTKVLVNGQTPSQIYASSPSPISYYLRMDTTPTEGRMVRFIRHRGPDILPFCKIVHILHPLAVCHMAESPSGRPPDVKEEHWERVKRAVRGKDNWAQLPFKETFKLFVSDVPYDVTVQKGDNVIPKLEKPAPSIKHLLQQLGTLRPGTATLRGSREHTPPRNAVLVMVSVIDDGNDAIGSSLRLFSKCTSITTFVTGTALFATVQLLALPIAVMTLTLVLAAAVFSRAITGWIVLGVNQTEPMLHVIVNSTQEAQHVIARIVSLDAHGEVQVRENEARKVQVEIGGHVFVEQRRVAHRTPWHLRILGVLVEPFDLRAVEMSESQSHNSSPLGELELGLLR
ncbi:MAG: hypothetical protein Q9218_005168, partial [Villophora microphyllina]